MPRNSPYRACRRLRAAQPRLENVTLVGLPRLSDGVVVQTVDVTPSGSVEVLDVEWPLAAGESYSLIDPLETNGHWGSVPLDTFPVTGVPGTQVDGGFGSNYGSDPSVVGTIWFTFTSLRTCLG